MPANLVLDELIKKNYSPWKNIPKGRFIIPKILIKEQSKKTKKKVTKKISNKLCPKIKIIQKIKL